MLKKYAAVMVILLFVVSNARAQDRESTRLRVMQLSFVPDVSAIVDVQIDEATVFEALSFPFATDYIELTPGVHTLTTTVPDQPTATVSTSFNLEAGRSYTAIIHGDYTDEVTFTLIDESELPLEASGSTAIVVNLTPYLIQDIYLDEELVLETINAGEYGFISLPPTEFMLAGKVGNEFYSEPFTPFSNTTLVAVVRLVPSGDMQVIYHRSSHLTIADYLRSIDDGAAFAHSADATGTVDLLDLIPDEGTYTLFLPTNEAFDADIELQVANHIIPQNLPPYILPNSDELTSLTGHPLRLDFSNTASGYWEIEGVPILWNISLANGVIYAIDGVIAE